MSELGLQTESQPVILGALTEQQRLLTLDDLTEAILNYNHQTLPTEVSEDVSTESFISLYHVHLPKWASKGFITYDPA